MLTRWSLTPYLSVSAITATRTHAGTGPAGQTCGTCSKLCRVHYHDKTYRKCHVLMKHWSHGGATDIRCKDPACKSWEPRVEKVEVGDDAPSVAARQLLSYTSKHG